MKLQTILLQCLDPRVSPTALDQIAMAANTYVNHDLGQIYGFNAFIARVDDPCSGPADAWICNCIPSLSDPDAIAYHTRNSKGLPMLYCGLDVILNNGGTIMDGPLSVSVGILHEIAEALFDPWCLGWSDFSASEEVAEEIIDPVQGDTYQIGNVTAPNFVTPNWFDAGALIGAQYDFLGNVNRPLTLHKNGYMVLRKGGPSGEERNVFGYSVPEFIRKDRMMHGRRNRKNLREAITGR